MGHVPSGASFWSGLHYAQTFLSGEFREFDYSKTRGGAGLNKKLYAQDEPPVINLKAAGTDVPHALFWGRQDTLTEQEDIEWLVEQLGASVVHSEGLHAGHLSFLVGQDMTYFTETAMNLIKTY